MPTDEPKSDSYYLIDGSALATLRACALRLSTKEPLSDDERRKLAATVMGVAVIVQMTEVPKPTGRALVESVARRIVTSAPDSSVSLRLVKTKKDDEEP
jgi:hypothetical protein